MVRTPKTPSKATQQRIREVEDEQRKRLIENAHLGDIDRPHRPMTGRDLCNMLQEAPELMDMPLVVQRPGFYRVVTHVEAVSLAFGGKKARPMLHLVQGDVAR